MWLDVNGHDRRENRTLRQKEVITNSILDEINRVVIGNDNSIIEILAAANRMHSPVGDAEAAIRRAGRKAGGRACKP